MRAEKRKDEPIRKNPSPDTTFWTYKGLQRPRMQVCELIVEPTEVVLFKGKIAHPVCMYRVCKSLVCRSVEVVDRTTYWPLWVAANRCRCLRRLSLSQTPANRNYELFESDSPNSDYSSDRRTNRPFTRSDLRGHSEIVDIKRRSKREEAKQGDKGFDCKLFLFLLARKADLQRLRRRVHIGAYRKKLSITILKNSNNKNYFFSFFLTRGFRR